MLTQPAFVGTPPRAQISARKAAIDAGFLDPNQFRIYLDRNARSRLLHAVRALETATRAKGKQNGAVGRPAVAILQALLFAAPVGAPVFVSWQWLQTKLGYCRATIATAIAALETIGVLKRRQRLTRDQHGHCRQSTNVYTFQEMAKRVILPRPPAERSSAFRARSFIATEVQLFDAKAEGLARKSNFESVLSRQVVRSAADWRDRTRAWMKKGR